MAQEEEHVPPSQCSEEQYDSEEQSTQSSQLSQDTLPFHLTPQTTYDDNTLGRDSGVGRDINTEDIGTLDRDSGTEGGIDAGDGDTLMLYPNMPTMKEIRIHILQLHTRIIDSQLFGNDPMTEFRAIEEILRYFLQQDVQRVIYRFRYPGTINTIRKIVIDMGQQISNILYSNIEVLNTEKYVTLTSIYSLAHVVLERYT